MKKLLFLIITLACGFKATSQDIIVKKDNTEIQAKVQELIGDLIKYKDFDNLDGPIKNIATTDVKFILYANGKKEYFGLSTTKPVELTPVLDAIVKTDKTEIKCKIVEITTDAVKYKNTVQPNEEILSIAKTNVFYILYANGKKEYVDAGGSTAPTTALQTLPPTNPDIIIKTDKTEVVCNIVDINDFELSYKIGSMSKSISKIDVAAIKFAKDSKFNISKVADTTANNIADTILLKDNSTITCRVLDKKGIAILYKIIDNNNDITYLENISNVSSIIYGEGIRVNFVPAKNQVATEPTISNNAPTVKPSAEATPIIAVPTTTTEKQANTVAIEQNNNTTDEIVKTDKAILKAKVLEVTETVVKYKRIENIEGPTYILKMIDLAVINYANGKKYVPEKIVEKPVSENVNTQESQPTNATDIIVNLDKTEMKVKIYNIEENEIRYKKIEMLDGPFRLIKKSNVLMIKYANGTTEKF